SGAMGFSVESDRNVLARPPVPYQRQPATGYPPLPNRPLAPGAARGAPACSASSAGRPRAAVGAGAHGTAARRGARPRTWSGTLCLVRVELLAGGRVRVCSSAILLACAGSGSVES